jgi:hypothetical protein
MKWLDSLRVKVLGGPPTGPKTTDEQHSADQRKADLAAADEREGQIEAESKHVEMLDTGEDDPNRYTQP